MKSYFLLSITFLLLVSCSKREEAPTDFSGTYHSVRFENTSSIRLFTRAGEIKSTQVIRAFVQQHQPYTTKILYPDGVGLTPKPQQTDTLRVLSARQAQLKEGNRYRQYTINQQGWALQFVPQDTLRIVLSGDNSDAFIAKHPPLYLEKRLIAMSAGYQYAYTMLIGKFATLHSSGRLAFPMLGYLIKREYSIGASLYNNEFNPKAYQQLQARDTLAIQAFRLIYQL